MKGALEATKETKPFADVPATNQPGTVIPRLYHNTRSLHALLLRGGDSSRSHHGHSCPGGPKKNCCKHTLNYDADTPLSTRGLLVTLYSFPFETISPMSDRRQFSNLNHTLQTLQGVEPADGLAVGDECESGSTSVMTRHDRAFGSLVNVYELRIL
jgi:hypothetical protein